MSGDRERDLVSVVIVNYNGGAFIGECLRSVFGQPYRPIEVIVVDNGSQDGSVAMIRSEFPEVVILENGRNLGFASANNIGVARARGRWVALLNNDTVVEADWLPALLREISVERTAVVTSRVVTEGVPTAYYEKNGSLNYIGYNIMRVFDDLSQVFFASGASLLFRRDLVGRPFLDEYFLYHEDVYLSWVLRMRGFTVRMSQGSVVHHRGSATTKTQPLRTITFYQGRNRLLNALLLYEMWTLVRLVPYFLLDAVVQVAEGARSGGKSMMGVLQGYMWCVARLPWIVRERTRHQSHRVVRDTEILRWMSCRLTEPGGWLASWVNTCSGLYARMVGLPYHE